MIKLSKIRNFYLRVQHLTYYFVYNSYEKNQGFFLLIAILHLHPAITKKIFLMFPISKLT